MRGQPRLLANFVGCHTIQGAMTLNGNCLHSVRVDGMLASFPQERKPILLKVSYKITALNGHLYLDCYLLKEGSAKWDLSLLLAIG